METSLAHTYMDTTVSTQRGASVATRQGATCTTTSSGSSSEQPTPTACQRNTRHPQLAFLAGSSPPNSAGTSFPKELPWSLQAADALRDRGRRAEILGQVDEVLAQQPGNTKGRRFDGTIHTPEAPDLHLDASLTHTCSSDKNRNQATLDMLIKECNLDFGHNAAHPTPTPAVSQRTQHKRDAYAPIMQRLRARTLQRRRAHCPEMVPVVISHLGEFSAGVFKVTETIAMAAYVRARDGPRHDGIHPKMHSADVRNMIKDRLICTVARGFGTMLGRPGMRPPPQQARC